MRSSIIGEKCHKIRELPVNISKYFERRLGLKYVGLTSNNLFSKITQINDILGSKIDFQCFRVHKVVRLHQHIQIFMCNIHFIPKRFGLQTHRSVFSFVVSYHRLQKFYSFLLLRGWLNLLFWSWNFRRWATSDIRSVGVSRNAWLTHNLRWFVCWLHWRVTAIWSGIAIKVF